LLVLDTQLLKLGNEPQVVRLQAAFHRRNKRLRPGRDVSRYGGPRPRQRINWRTQNGRKPMPRVT
jgi:hypothetical protein